MKNIQAVAFRELCKQNIGGTLPVLLELYNEDLYWNDGSFEQEDCYLRVVNDAQSVVYQGKKYIPCSFEMTMPEEDGKALKPPTLTVSAIDSRIAQTLRTAALKSEVSLKAYFVKKKYETEGGETKEKFVFCPMTNYKFKVGSASCTRVSATLNLEAEDILSLQVSRDKATVEKFPALMSEG